MKRLSLLLPAALLVLSACESSTGPAPAPEPPVGRWELGMWHTNPLPVQWGEIVFHPGNTYTKRVVLRGTTDTVTASGQYEFNARGFFIRLPDHFHPDMEYLSVDWVVENSQGERFPALANQLVAFFPCARANDGTPTGLCPATPWSDADTTTWNP